ncbi:MAG: phosphatase PAP2 family protein [Alphaproteobacteria bacterium]|nr:phosphatase PAP2 family protein [Alphaproteobacteria bacterium]
MTAAVLVAAAVLVHFDGIDKTIAGLFYVPGEGYPARFGSEYHVGIRRVVRLLGWGAGMALLFALIWRVFLGRRLWDVSRQTVLYLCLVISLGPGLLVNGILKEYWGRARPSQIVEFGGDKSYTPPFVITDQCETNCSFVSGDASIGFVFIALGFVATRRSWRVAGFALGIGLGCLFGYTRIVQGGHFFSDVLFSGVFVIALAWLLHELVIKRDILALPLMLLPDKSASTVG